MVPVKVVGIWKLKWKNQTFFSEVFIGEKLKTVSWPGELDLDPDNLYKNGIDVELFKNLLQAVKNKDDFSNFIVKKWLIKITTI